MKKTAEIYVLIETCHWKNETSRTKPIFFSRNFSATPA